MRARLRCAPSTLTECGRGAAASLFFEKKMGDDTEVAPQLPLLAEMSDRQVETVAIEAGATIAKGLWELHAEDRWTLRRPLPTADSDEETQLVEKTREHVLKTLAEHQVLRVRPATPLLSVYGTQRLLNRLSAFFLALLRVGDAAVALHNAWKHGDTSAANSDTDPDALPFDFPPLLMESLETHFKANVQNAVAKALQNNDEILRRLFQCLNPPDDDEDDEEESVDEGSDIGDSSESLNSSESGEEEEEEEEEEEPASKKQK